VTHPARKCMRRVQPYLRDCFMRMNAKSACMHPKLNSRTDSDDQLFALPVFAGAWSLMELLKTTGANGCLSCSSNAVTTSQKAYIALQYLINQLPWCLCV
jgi:hypothetical protein